MTNNEAISYSIVALNKLIRQGIVKTKEKDIYSIMDRMMWELMDVMDEDGAVEKANKILSGCE